MARIEVYEGNEPYIFVSYAHKDSARVLPIIAALQEEGYRIWYDAGIVAGTEWPEYIAGHIKKSGCVLLFLSESYIVSQNCRQELTFAQANQIPMLNVYLENVTLTDGMQMQLGLNQCLFFENHRDSNSFFNELLKAPILAVSYAGTMRYKPTREQPVQNRPTREQPVPPRPAAAPPRRAPKPSSMLSQTEQNAAKFNRIVWLIALARVVLAPLVTALSNSYIGLVKVNLKTFLSEGLGWKYLLLLLVNLLPHAVILLVVYLLHKYMTRNASKAQIENTGSMWGLSSIVSLGVSAVICCFFVYSAEHIFFKILFAAAIHFIVFCVETVIWPSIAQEETKQQ